MSHYLIIFLLSSTWTFGQIGCFKISDKTSRRPLFLEAWKFQSLGMGLTVSQPEQTKIDYAPVISSVDLQMDVEGTDGRIKYGFDPEQTADSYTSIKRILRKYNKQMCLLTSLKSPEISAPAKISLIGFASRFGGILPDLGMEEVINCGNIKGARLLDDWDM